MQTLAHKVEKCGPQDEHRCSNVDPIDDRGGSVRRALDPLGDYLRFLQQLDVRGSGSRRNSFRVRDDFLALGKLVWRQQHYCLSDGWMNKRHVVHLDRGKQPVSWLQRSTAIVVGDEK